MKKLENLEISNSVSEVLVDKNQVKIALLQVPDKHSIAAKLFNKIAGHGYIVDMIIHSAQETRNNDIVFTVKKDDADAVVAIAREISEEIGCKGVFVNANLAKVSIVGVGLAGKAEVAARMFKALGNANINIHMINISEIKISCIVNLDESEEAAKAIRQTFIAEKVSISN